MDSTLFHLVCARLDDEPDRVPSVRINPARSS
ncbi:hypothetical protein SAMN04488085_10945 [Geodermatophilus ruber]|uniref:Uncharacterized protein n=1 Tax=Geodermatophilus ruber TaxID=504800 RepID=A0A1I4GJJ9_9ACTN|nr:hypothetical protein SAMN04488085_10945 [Geodermatophilus ruber]